VRLAELMMEAGAPEGVLNVVHGDKAAVDAILTHPLIRAVSFVGSSDIAQYVYSTGTAHGKRVQAFGGAKNHGIVLPDADMETTVRDLVGAAYGSAGERCMALPVVVPVGQKTADELRERLVSRSKPSRSDTRPTPRPSTARRHPAAPRPRGRLDRHGRAGRLRTRRRRPRLLPARLGEGLLHRPDAARPREAEMRSYQEEIFGPCCRSCRAADFEEALSLPTKHQYGNGVAIFTRDGRAARDFAARVEVGMVGINVPIPVPVAYHSFGGWKRSGFGDINQHGMEGVRFWTKTKTVTQRFPETSLEGGHQDSSFVIPTMR
jgi:malonate-semialdehyde dehydrogenase (acetylating)/methylmalonate-semialdehyde dehydrogenase